LLDNTLHVLNCTRAFDWYFENVIDIRERNEKEASRKTTKSKRDQENELSGKNSFRRIRSTWESRVI